MPFFRDMVVSDFFVHGSREWDVEVIHEVFPDLECERILKTTWVLVVRVIPLCDILSKMASIILSLLIALRIIWFTKPRQSM